ncbi:N-chimaerin [Desmophyllum pertusum]|uniref:N-chimaerin n=1 Tax=Desmophyllum pertusum TaxID=174260 RepID=A0A9X0CVR1_9CNID|nr:N-chimaerin [Desmophyllum pertusum]
MQTDRVLFMKVHLLQGNFQEARSQNMLMWRGNIVSPYEGSVSSSRVGSVPRCKPKPLGRGAPDGNSVKEKHREGIPPSPALRLDTVDKMEIHSSAPDGQSVEEKYRDAIRSSPILISDMDMTEAESLLQNKNGVYILRKLKSQTAQSGMALSVGTGDRVAHFKIFYEENQGYALQIDGPRFNKIEDLINHYYDLNLHSCNVKLTRPYK